MGSGRTPPPTPPSTSGEAEKVICSALLLVDPLPGDTSYREALDGSCDGAPQPLWMTNYANDLQQGGVVAPLPDDRILVLPDLLLTLAEFRCWPKIETQRLEYRGRTVAQLTLWGPDIQAIAEHGEVCDEFAAPHCSLSCTYDPRVDVAVTVEPDGTTYVHTWTTEVDLKGEGFDPVAACASH